MGKIDLGIKCSISNCNDTAVKSVSNVKAKSAGFNVNEGKNAYLCKVHYKELKKKLKKERVIEKWRYRV